MTPLASRIIPLAPTVHRPVRGTVVPAPRQLTPTSPSDIVGAISTALRYLHAERLLPHPYANSGCAPAPAPVSARFSSHTIAP